MSLWSTGPHPAPCPACDAWLTLDGVHRGDGAPTCSTCGLLLVPRRVAGFSRRAAAALLDLVVLAVTAGPLQVAVHWALEIERPVARGGSIDAVIQWLTLPPELLLRWMIPALGIAATYVVLFTSLAGATLGQRALGLEVIGSGGSRISLSRSLTRTLALALALAPGGLGILWIAFDREKRGLHDHLAQTYVVTRRRS